MTSTDAPHMQAVFPAVPGRPDRDDPLLPGKTSTRLFWSPSLRICLVMLCSGWVAWSITTALTPQPLKESLFFSKSLPLSPINQWRIVYGAQEISFRVRENKGLVFYTVFITATSPFRALYFAFMWLFFTACFPVLVQSITFYSGMEHFIQLGINCLQVPEPTTVLGWFGDLVEWLGEQKGAKSFG